MELEGIHHVAIICADYSLSKNFYTRVLGFEIVKETYREERKSYKLDLRLKGEYCIELFYFPNPPKRASQPEACGLRHLAFSVRDIEKQVGSLRIKGVTCEKIRIDEITGKKFTFFSDPDNLPIELYEV